MDKNNSSSILKKNFDNQIIFHDDFDHENSPKTTLNVQKDAISPKYKTIPTKERIFQKYSDTIEQINPKDPQINATLKNSVAEENMGSKNLLYVKNTQQIKIRTKNNSDYAPSYDPETQRVRKHRSALNEKSTNEKLKEIVQQQIQERQKWQQNTLQTDPNFKTIQSTQNNNLKPGSTNDPESLKKTTSSQKLGKLNDQKFAATNLQKNHLFQQAHPQDGDYIAPKKQVKQQKVNSGQQDKKKKNAQQIQSLKKKPSTYEVLNQHEMKSGSIMVSLADKQTPAILKHPITKQSKNKFTQNSKTQQTKTRIIGVDIKNLSSFVKSPISNDKYIQGNVNRDSSCLGKTLFPEYSIQIDEISALYAKKTLKGYDIFVGDQQNNIPLSNMQKVATVKGNLLGSYYNIYSGQNQQQIIATVYYNSEMTTKSIVRDVELYIKVGDVTVDGSEMDVAMVYNKDADLKTLYGVMGCGNMKIEKFVSKVPKYDDKTKMYTLDFETKKISMPSVQNVILVSSQDQKQKTLVFGKCGYDNFYLRIQNPLSPIIAMGYLMTSFNFKWVTQ